MFNRGFRRDDRNSFRSNTNMSRGHNAPSLMSVSPWEGGVVPGSGGSSILGNPQLQSNPNMLTPQAQVLAQNLNILSNLGLLQPQLQQRQSQTLPSLINLGSALNRTLNLGHQNSGYQNRGPINRYQDQRPKYGRPDGRRIDSFNKNRPRTSQSQTSQQKLQSYRPLNSKIAPPSTTRKQGSQGGEDSLAKARADVRGKRVKKESKSDAEDVEGDEDVKKEEGEEVVKKRDWKKEKKTDVVEVDDDEDGKEKTDADVTVLEDEESKSNGVAEIKDEKKVKEGEEKEESGTEGKDGDKSAKSSETSIYNCHVCAKTLADDEALNTHLRSASHKRMMNQLEETYALKVKRIRDQMRTIEQQKELEMNIRGRGRRTNLQRGHCKMCDLTFLGNITAHRKTPLHVKLKNFLHPNCAPCGKEFPARMEWDMHKLTTEHLRIVAGIDKRLKKLMGSASTRSEPNYARLVPKFPEGLDSVIANMDEELADKTAADAETSDDGTLTYNPVAVTGINMLVHGQHCGACNKFFARRPDALEHCKTRTHFDNYVLLKAKLKAAAEEEAARLEAEAKAKEAAAAEAKAKADAEAAGTAGSDTENKKTPEEEKGVSGVKVDLLDKTAVVCLKRAVTRKDEGNWKRSRNTKNEEDEDDVDEEEEEVEPLNPSMTEDVGDDDVTEVTSKATEDDKYDPLQPTSPAHSNETNPLETSFELLQAVENDLDNMDTQDTEKDVAVVEVIDEGSPAAKPANKARRGRKRK